MGKNEFEKKNIAFITCGDIFSAGDVTWITGYATTKIKVKDVLLFEGDKYKIEDMQIVGKNSVKKVDAMVECALSFKKINKEEFKNIVNEACKRDVEVNTPFKFGEEPSTLYTSFYIK